MIFVAMSWNKKNTEAEGQKPEAPHGLFDRSNLTVNL